MTTEEVMPEKAKCPTLEIIKQDFYQEAKTLIAQHYEKINDNKVQGTSINVFRKKHRKPKSGKYIPLEIDKKETRDVVQEHRAALRRICFPKELSKSEHLQEPPQRISFKEPHIFSRRERCRPIDLITKGQVKLDKIMTIIEPVSKKMETAKQQHFEESRNRMLELFYPFPVHLYLQPGTSTLALLKEPDKAFYDWRGFVPTRSFRLACDSGRVSFSQSSSIFQDSYSKTFKTFIKKERQPIKPEPKSRPRIKGTPNETDKLDSKVKRIGPHIEIFQVFRERKKFVITPKLIRMVTIMQAHVRGWLERKRLQRVMTKALDHGPDMKAVINMYGRLIHRVRYRHGLWRTRQIVNLAELEEWMDRKKFYEIMFAKREDWPKIERSELPSFFSDCGHFPSQKQIDDTWDLVHQDGKEKYSELIKKSKAIEMLFTLYPPEGAHVPDSTLLKSTWLRPIVNGEEGYRYIVNGHPALKRANIQVVGKLVARSIRERKMRQHYKSCKVE
ncbi:IQ domain-containing protein M isoform X2 [Symphalangus syndactylus]|uniref:IQ domain-containing protein M isoform X2 n=1 Tax=Symphalangus syndactylus TaxID=9590 RepID=UPI0024427AF5|nr:IQ domain-containing protein M [Symphalangus syndactylus]